MGFRRALSFDEIAELCLSGSRIRRQHAPLLDELHHLVDTLQGLEVGRDPGAAFDGACDGRFALGQGLALSPCGAGALALVATHSVQAGASSACCRRPIAAALAA